MGLSFWCQPTGAALSPLDAVQLLSLRGREIRRGKVDAVGELEPQVRLLVDGELAARQVETEHVPAGAPVVCDEVEVVAGHVEPLGVAGKAEAHDAAGHV